MGEEKKVNKEVNGKNKKKKRKKSREPYKIHTETIGDILRARAKMGDENAIKVLNAFNLNSRKGKYDKKNNKQRSK